MKENIAREKLMELAEDLIENEQTVSFWMQGYSMFPTLYPGDLGLVEKCDPASLKSGDIIVFRQNKQLVAHRLMRVTTASEKRFILKGDKNNYYDQPVAEQDIIGKLTGVIRKNKTWSFEGSSQRFRKLLALKVPVISSGIYSAALSVRLRNRRYHERSRELSQNVRLISEGSGRLFLVNALISVFQGLVPLATIVAIKKLIDELTKSSVHTGSSHFLLWLIITGALFLTSGILTELNGFFSEKLSQSVSRLIYKKLHTKHESLNLSGYEIPSEQDKMLRAVQEASFRPVKMLNELLGVIRSVTASVFLAGIFLTIRWYLPVILLVAVLPGIIIRIKYARLNYRLKTSQSTKEREMYYYNRVLTGFPFAKELRLFGFSGFFKKRFSNVQNDLFEEKITLRQAEMKGGIAAQVFAILLIFGSMGYISYLSMTSSITVGTVVLFFFAFQRGYSVINELFQSFARIFQDNTFLQDFTSFLQAPENNANHTDRNNFSLKKEILFENAGFRYESSKRQALKAVNLVIPAGKKVAFVGENGSGKTTAIKLLCGFYSPENGQITYDGIPTQEINQQEILKHISAVFQDFALYNLTVSENIGLGNPAVSFDKEKAREAAKKAGIHDILEKLPFGYDNLLGNQFEGGEELSIGQWQKMAIARAFYRDADLIILDEPSSALDAHSEKQIIETLKQLTEDKTAVIVSHRLTTVQWADIIYYFQEGEVLESGTHTELMERKGGYYRLFKAISSRHEIQE